MPDAEEMMDYTERMKRISELYAAGKPLFPRSLLISIDQQLSSAAGSDDPNPKVVIPDFVDETDTHEYEVNVPQDLSERWFVAVMAKETGGHYVLIMSHAATRLELHISV
jgi:hypothetical protein